MTVVLSETRAEVLKAVRLPAFILPVLLFPAMFYVLFGLVMGGSVGGMAMPAYLLGSYGAFGVIGAALFGMGVSVAAERWSIGSPTCQPPVPKLSTVASTPAAARRSLRTTSATGERQMLPRQTTAIR